MKKTSKLIAFTFLSLAIVTSSCEKKSIKNESGLPDLKEMSYDEREATRPAVSQSQVDYMNSLPMYDKVAFDKAIANLSHSSEKANSPIVMAIGGSNRIFQWNGSSWDEPNPNAHLWQVEASKNYAGGSVWGTNTTYHIFRRTGYTTWLEPNQYAALRMVVPVSNLIAYGIGVNSRIYTTIDGGVTWSLFTTATDVSWLSVGSYNQLWIIKGINTPTQPLINNLFKYDFGTGSLMMIPTGFRSERVSTSLWGGAVYTTRITPLSSGGYSRTMYKKINNGAFTLTPFPNEQEISSNGDDSNLWMIGTGNNIYNSPVNGDWWNEPNTAARAYMITAGFY